MAPEDLPILAGTTPKPGFLDSHEPRNHTREKREGRGERGEEKRTAGTHNFYIAYFGDSFWTTKKCSRHTARTPPPSGTVFKNPGIYIYEPIRKNCAITFSLCAGRSPGQSLPRPTKSEVAWRQTAHHSAPRGPSLRSRRKRGRGRGARTREKNGGLGARDEGTPATKTPYFFISAAASGRKLLIG